MIVVNKKLWIITITLLVVTECVFTYLSVKSYGNKDITEIKEENNVNKEMFSMYVEQEDGSYKEYTDNNLFTIDGYELNVEKSNCTDNKGKVVSDIISYNNNKITVSSNKTIFCYLYFDKANSVYAKVISDYTSGNGVNKVSSISEETENSYDAYYYTGSIANNNILYGGYCWKMIITTETKGVKLIYNGVPGTDSDGNPTCDNSGTSAQLTTKKAFNSLSNSPAYVGYMYNSAYTYSGNSFLSTSKILQTKSMAFDDNGLTYGDSVTYENGKYTLNNYKQYFWSEWENLVGYYACPQVAYYQCETVYYVVGTTSSKMYYYELSDGNIYEDVKIKLATSITDNGDGTYTLNNPIEITRADYYPNYSSYKNYYYCADLTSTTCSDMYYSYDTTETTLSANNVANNYKYGNSFTYSNGVYKLVDTNTSSIKQFWNWNSNYNTLSNNHYTCFNTSGECTNLYYVYYTGNVNAYYITLSGGKSVSDALNEMLYSDDVNTTNSPTKDYIDTWYEENLLETTDTNGVLYSKYLENAIFCNNREISNLNSSGWDPNGGSTTTNMFFNFDSLECANRNDRFTLKETMGGTKGYGNNALDYPIGLLSYKEANLATSNGYLNSGSHYWLLSPYTFNSANAQEWLLSSGGTLSSLNVNLSFFGGIRPVVSLSSSVEIDGGDGSVTSPYQVKLSSY